MCHKKANFPATEGRDTLKHRLTWRSWKACVIISKGLADFLSDALSRKKCPLHDDDVINDKKLG